jgi:hypothetical protein
MLKFFFRYFVLPSTILLIAFGVFYLFMLRDDTDVFSIGFEVVHQPAFLEMTWTYFYPRILLSFLAGFICLVTMWYKLRKTKFEEKD